MGGFAWVTLATNDSYSLGALVLAYSLKQVNTNYQLAVMVTPGVTESMRLLLRNIFDVVCEVNILDSKDETNLLLLQRPELGVTFTKLHCWHLTQFEKCVFLDADTLVLQNCDELFEREELSAAPDVGWPDCFNSGVFVYQPSMDTYKSLIKFALEKGSFDGGDQGLLNLYFCDWAYKDIRKHLPFIYNMCSTAGYSYLPAFKQYGEGVRIIHFIGASKPWLQYFNSTTLQVSPIPEFQHLHRVLQHWWDLFCSHIHSKLTDTMARINTSVASSCTSLFHIPTNDYESKCENSLCTKQLDSSFSNNMTMWDPWENYQPESDAIQNSKIDTLNTNLHICSRVNESAKSFCLYEQQTSHETNSNLDLNKSEHNDSVPYISDSFSNNSSFGEYPKQSDDNSNDHCQYTISNKYFHKYDNMASNNRLENKNTNIQNQYPDSSLVHARSMSFNENIHDIECLSAPIYISHSTNCSPCTYHVQESSSTYMFHPHNHYIGPNIECDHKSANAEQPSLALAIDSNEAEMDKHGGLAGAFAEVTLGKPRSPNQDALEENLRRQGWEVGNIDYLGRDSFDNIWKKICETLGNISDATKQTDQIKESLPITQGSTAVIVQTTPPISTSIDKIASENTSQLITDIKEIVQDREPTHATTTTVQTTPPISTPIDKIAGENTSQLITDIKEIVQDTEPTNATTTTVQTTPPISTPIDKIAGENTSQLITDIKEIVQDTEPTNATTTTVQTIPPISTSIDKIAGENTSQLTTDIKEIVQDTEPTNATTTTVQTTPSISTPIDKIAGENTSQLITDIKEIVQDTEPTNATTTTASTSNLSSPVLPEIRKAEKCDDTVTPVAAGLSTSDSQKQTETLISTKHEKTTTTADIAKSSVMNIPVEIPKSTHIIQEQSTTEANLTEAAVPTDISKADTMTTIEQQTKSVTENLEPAVEKIAISTEVTQESVSEKKSQDGKPTHTAHPKILKSKEKHVDKSKSKQTESFVGESSKQAPTPPPRKPSKNGGTGASKKSSKKK